MKESRDAGKRACFLFAAPREEVSNSWEVKLPDRKGCIVQELTTSHKYAHRLEGGKQKNLLPLRPVCAIPKRNVLLPHRRQTKTHTLRSRWGSRSSGRRGVRLPHPTPLLRDCWRTMGCRVWVGKNAQTQQPKRKKNVGETAAQQQKS